MFENIGKNKDFMTNIRNDISLYVKAHDYQHRHSKRKARKRKTTKRLTIREVMQFQNQAEHLRVKGYPAQLFITIMPPNHFVTEQERKNYCQQKRQNFCKIINRTKGDVVWAYTYEQSTKTDLHMHLVLFFPKNIKLKNKLQKKQDLPEIYIEPIQSSADEQKKCIQYLTKNRMPGAPEYKKALDKNLGTYKNGLNKPVGGLRFNFSDAAKRILKETGYQRTRLATK